LILSLIPSKKLIAYRFLFHSIYQLNKKLLRYLSTEAAVDW